MGKKFKYKVDKRMHSYGEIDYDKGLIRVNPRKGDLINTVIHEDLHKKYPDKPEKWINKKAKKVECSLSVPQAMNLLKKLQRRKDGKR